jgi:transcriptional regulator with XRE-family HTH domain
VSAPASAKEAIRLAVRRKVVERGLSYRDLAQRTGLHARTVERFLEGETFELATLDTLLQHLRIDAAAVAELGTQAAAVARRLEARRARADAQALDELAARLRQLARELRAEAAPELEAA